MKAGGAVVAEDEASALGADEAPVGVDVGRPRPLLCLEGRRIVLGADDVSLGQLDGPRRHAVVTRVIGSRAADTVHKLLIILHNRVTRILTSARVTRVVRAVDVAVDNLVLGPDGELGQTRVMEELATAGHVAPRHLAPVALPAYTTHVSARPAGLAPELLHAHLVRVDPDTATPDPRAPRT